MGDFSYEFKTADGAVYTVDSPKELSNDDLERLAFRFAGEKQKKPTGPSWYGTLGLRPAPPPAPGEAFRNLGHGLGFATNQSPGYRAAQPLGPIDSDAELSPDQWLYKIARSKDAKVRQEAAKAFENRERFVAEAMQKAQLKVGEINKAINEGAFRFLRSPIIPDELLKRADPQGFKAGDALSRKFLKPVTDTAIGAVNPLGGAEMALAGVNDPVGTFDSILRSFTAVLDPKAPIEERIASGTQWAATLFALGKTAVKGKVLIDNVRIRRTLQSEFGITAEQAKTVVRASEAMANRYAQSKGFVKGGIEKLRQAMNYQGREELGRLIAGAASARGAFDPAVAPPMNPNAVFIKPPVPEPEVLPEQGAPPKPIPEVPADVPPPTSGRDVPIPPAKTETPLATDKRHELNDILPIDSDDPKSVVVSTDDGTSTRIRAEPVRIGDFTFYVHPRFRLDDDSPNGWTVTEPTTGIAIVQGEGQSREEAIEAATRIIETQGPDKVRKVIANALKKRNTTKEQTGTNDGRTQVPDGSAGTGNPDGTSQPGPKSQSPPTSGKASAVRGTGKDGPTKGVPPVDSGSSKPDRPRGDSERPDLGGRVRDGETGSVSPERGGTTVPGRDSGTPPVEGQRPKPRAPAPTSSPTPPTGDQTPTGTTSVPTVSPNSPSPTPNVSPIQPPERKPSGTPEPKPDETRADGGEERKPEATSPTSSPISPTEGQTPTGTSSVPTVSPRPPSPEPSVSPAQPPERKPGGTPEQKPDKTRADGGEEPKPEATSPTVSPSETPKPKADDGPERTDSPEQGKGDKPVTATDTQKSKPRRKNHRFDPEAIGKGTFGQKTEDLIRAVETLKAVEQSGKLPTKEQVEAIARFPGWGWTGNHLNVKSPPNRAWLEKVRKVLTDEEFSAAEAATKNSHFTHPTVILAIWKALRRMGYRGGKAIEPSAGTGLFIGLEPSSNTTKWSAVELDNLTARILGALMPEADLRPMGYEATKYPAESFDLAISNVPFGNYKVYDPALVKETGDRGFVSRIHNYFFIKALGHVRPGGLVAFITTHGTLDASDPVASAVRNYIGSKADVLGAIRLPNNAFKENAGTEVVTDIVFLRKRGEGEPPRGALITGVGNIRTAENANFLINQYFLDHPEMVIGEHSSSGKMYQGGDYSVVFSGEDFAKELERAIARLPKDVYAEGKTASTLPEREGIVAPQNVRVGSYFEFENKIYVKDDDGNGYPIEIPKAAIEAVRAYLPIRDTVVELLDVQRLSATADLRPLQTRLKTAYDKYVKAFGPLNGKYVKYLDQDPESAAALMLENFERKGGTAIVTGLADIFERRVLSPNVAVESVGSARDALVASLKNLGRLDLDEMMRVSGLSEDEIRTQLRGQIYRDPTTGQWTTADEYGSGNVRKKLKEALAAASRDNDFQENAEFLESRQPRNLEPHEISAKIGSPWIPLDVFTEFYRHLVDAEPWQVGLKFNKTLSTYYLTSSVRNAYVFTRFGTERMGANDIYLSLLNSKSIRITNWDPTLEKAVFNPEATQLAEAKADEIRKAWNEWIYGDPERAKRLAAIYNEEINVYVARRYDGSFLTFPGQSTLPHPKTGKPIELRAHQKDAVWRILQKDTTLLAHDVGTGKTITLITAAMELRRTGLRRKVMIAVKNDTEGQFAEAFRMLYPGARLLLVDKEKINPKNRKRLFGQIAGNDWDAIIVRHSDFGKIPVSPRLQERYFLDRIKEYVSAREAADKEEGGSSPTVKDLSRAIENLRVKLRNARDKIAKRQDDSLYWEQLGVDELFVDEAHEYKNLDVISNDRSLRTDGSQRARDLFIKIDHLREVEAGTVFATGTPIANSLAELHGIFRYLNPKELEAQGVFSFDPWTRTYAEKTTEFQQDVAGRWKSITKFSKFSNIPELQQMFREIADVVGKEEVGEVTLPKLIDEAGKEIGKTIVIESSPNSTQISYFRDLFQRAERVKQGLDPRIDNVLKISTDGRKGSMDIRLVDPSFPDDPNSKVNQAVRKVMAIYKDQKVEKERGTQFIFLDYGTPKETKPTPKDVQLTGHRSIETAEAEGAKLQTLNYEYVIVDGEDGTFELVVDLSPSFNLYDDMKAKLIKAGVPAGEIAYVHDAKTDAEKVVLFEKVNRGDVRILFGSTFKGGVGVNVQERLRALHHLDAPWRPADYEQRTGRIERQGNRWAFLGGIQVYDYINVGTYDAFMWNKLAAKQRFIRQVMRGEATLREAEDISDDGASSYAEIAAAASGDPRVSTYLQLEQTIKRLESERLGFIRQQQALSGEIFTLEKATIPGLRDSLAEAQAMNRARLAAKPEDFELKVGNQTFDSSRRKEAGIAFLQALSQAVKDTSDKAIATYSGFDLVPHVSARSGDVFVGIYAQMSKPSFKTSAALPMTDQVFREDFSGVGTTTTARIERYIDDLGESVERLTKSITDAERKLQVAKDNEGAVWPHEKKMEDSKRRFAELDAEIGERLRKGEMGGWGQASGIDNLAASHFKPGRIEIDPLPGGFDGKIGDLILDLGKLVGTRILQKKRKQRGAGGAYFPGTYQTTIRFFNDISTAAHETAHALDDLYGIVADWANDPKKRSPYDGELEWFWERGGSGGPTMPLPYNRAEGVAEFIRALIVNPDEAKKQAPTFYRFFAAKVPGQVINAIEELGTKIRRWAGSTNVEKVRASILTDLPPDVPLGEKITRAMTTGEEGYRTRAVDYFRMRIYDHLAPFETAVRVARERRGFDRLRPSNDPVLLARAYPGFNKKFGALLKHGLIDRDGKVVTPPVRNLFLQLDTSSDKAMRADLEDLNVLLVSQRVSEKVDLKADELAEQVAEAEALLEERMQDKVDEFRKRTIRLYMKEAEARFRGEESKAKLQKELLKAGVVKDRKTEKGIDKKLRLRKAKILAAANSKINKAVNLYTARLDRRHQRAVARIQDRAAKQLQRYSASITPAGGRILNSTNVHNAAILELMANPARFERLLLMAKAYRRYADAGLRYLVQKGRLSAESYNQIKEKNQQYAAMQRFLGQHADENEHLEGFGFSGGKSLTSAKETLQKFTGSLRQINDPVANLLENLYAMYREADRNEIMAAFYRLVNSGRQMYGGKPIDLAGIAQVVTEPGENVVPVWVGGKKTYLMLEKGVLESLRRNGEIFVPDWWQKAMSVPAKVYKTGIVNMPPFVVRNRIRDTVDTAIKTQHGVGLFGTFRGTTTEEQRIYDVFFGGIGRAEYLDDRANFYKVRNELIAEMNRDKSGSRVLNRRMLARLYSDLRESSERGPRMAEFRKAMTEARGRYKAVYDQRLFGAQAARDLIDFAQAGQLSRFLSRYFMPFFNAQIQGQRAMFKAMRKNPRRFARRWAFYALVPSVLTYLWNRESGNEEEYRELPAYQRDMFWNFKTGDNFWVRIPKPFELGVAGSGAERMLDYLFGNPQAFEGWTDSLQSALVPFDESSLAGGPAAPVFENVANYDFFRNKNIVPPHEEGLNMDLRERTDHSSSIGIFLQRTTGIDARKADHAITGFFGISGSMIQTLSDVAREDRPVMPARLTNTLFGITAESPGYSSPNVQFVMREARGAGVQENPLKPHLAAYFNAKTPADKDKAAKNLRESAARLRLLIEAAISRNPDRRSQVVKAVLDPKKERAKANPLERL